MPRERRFNVFFRVSLLDSGCAMSPSRGETSQLTMFFLTTQTNCRQCLKYFSLTHMASFALFPSIASVFTLKSTPDQSR